MRKFVLIIVLLILFSAALGVYAQDPWWTACPTDPETATPWPIQPTYTPRPTPTCRPTATLAPNPSPTPYPTEPPYPPQPSVWCETRATWLNAYAFNTDGARTDTLALIEATNLNTLFVAAPPVGGNVGWSTDETFSKLLTEAKAMGLSVHGWICNRYRVSGTLADFRDPVEQEQQKQWALDLLEAYPDLDGVHLDYIRFEFGLLDKEKINGVSDTVKLIYLAVKESYPDKYLTAAVKPLGQECADWDAEYIPDWYRTWFANNPGNRWDYFCYPDGTCCDDGVPDLLTFSQDPVTWIMNDHIDNIVSMEYTHDDGWWNWSAWCWNSFLPDRGEQAYMGIGWYTDSHFADPAHVVRKIKVGRSEGLRGFSIFEFGNPNTDYVSLTEILTADSVANDFDAPCKEPVPSCLRK